MAGDFFGNSYFPGSYFPGSYFGESEANPNAMRGSFAGSSAFAGTLAGAAVPAAKRDRGWLPRRKAKAVQPELSRYDVERLVDEIVARSTPPVEVVAPVAPVLPVPGVLRGRFARGATEFAGTLTKAPARAKPVVRLPVKRKPVAARPPVDDDEEMIALLLMVA